MSNLRFASPEHRDFFLDMMGEARRNDCYHRAFFYVMGIAPETRANIRQMFDFKQDCIEPDGMPRRMADQRHHPGVPPCFQPLERLYRPGAQQRLLPGGFVLLRVCPLFYGGRENPLPGILPGAAACKKAGGTGPIICLNGGMNHGRIGSCPAGTPADH